MARQQLGDILISFLRRDLKCSPALTVLCIYIRTTFNKQAYDLETPGTLAYCAKQWRVAAVVPGIHIGTAFEQ